MKSSTKTSVREKMLKLLHKKEIDELIVAPIVEVDYAASITGRKFCSEISGYDAYFYAAEECGYDPIFEVTHDVGNCVPQLKTQVDIIGKTDTSITRKHIFSTPKGNLEMVTREEVGLVPMAIEAPPWMKSFTGYWNGISRKLPPATWTTSSANQRSL